MKDWNQLRSKQWTHVSHECWTFALLIPFHRHTAPAASQAGAPGRRACTEPCSSPALPAASAQSCTSPARDWKRSTLRCSSPPTRPVQQQSRDKLKINKAGSFSSIDLSPTILAHRGQKTYWFKHFYLTFDLLEQAATPTSGIHTAVWTAPDPITTLCNTEPS